MVYRVRRGEKNEPLRYSLRSLANLPHGQVFIVGHTPRWVQGVVSLDGSRATNRYRATLEHLVIAARHLAGRRFVLLDDDQIVLRPHRSVPAWHRGPLDVHAAFRVGTYGRSLRHTADYLRGLGLDNARSYELHLPLPVDADAAVAALEPALSAPYPVQARTVYGNLAGIGGRSADDCKVAWPTPPPNGYLSVSPSTWRHGWAADVAERFPTPSPYEAR